MSSPNEDTTMTGTTAGTQEALDVKGLRAAYEEMNDPSVVVRSQKSVVNSVIRAYLSATTRAPGEGEPAADARILEFGKGELVVDTGTYLGRPCVFICAAKTPGEVGASAKREGHDKHSLQPHEVVLVFPTMEQADAVDAALIPYTAPPALAAPSYAQPASRADLVEALKRRLDYRMNEHLAEMKPDFDDSITGFNEAWKIVDNLFAEAAIAALSEAPREAGIEKIWLARLPEHAASFAASAEEFFANLEDESK